MSCDETGVFVFTWKIENYSSCYQAKGEKIVSPFFTIDNIPGSQWSLLFYPKGSSILRDDENYVSCFIEWKPLSEDCESAAVSLSIDILDEKAKPLDPDKTKEYKFNKESSSVGYTHFFLMESLEGKRSNWLKDVLTIRCRIRSYDQSNQKLKVTELVACTTLDVDRCSMEWHIEIPSLFDYSEDLTFPVSDKCNLELTLNYLEQKMGILIRLKDCESESPWQMAFAFSLFDRIGCRTGLKRTVHAFENKEFWKFPDFITKGMLRNCEVNFHHLDFTLKCEVSICKKTSSNCIETLKFASPCSLKSLNRSIFTSAIHSDFRKILFCMDSSDLTIRGKCCEFSAHSFTLKVRSQVLDLLENKNGVVDMGDIDAHVLKAFLEYLYTDSVDGMNYDIAKNLISTASQYKVPALVDMCASFLISCLSIKNACEIILIADKIGNQHMKFYALDFIIINAAEILPTPEWNKLIASNIKLATSVLTELSSYLFR